MVIHGLNKLTLLDFPGKTACTVFTGGCNFRCPFCHNASLVLDVGSQPIISENEFFDFLATREGLLDGVAITGGEPTISAGLPEFLKKIKDKGFAVKLDTNGNNFEALKYLVENKLVDYVAMDIKNSLDKYGETIGINNFDTNNISSSIKYLIDGDVDYEFRTTVVDELHDENDFVSIKNLISGAKRYFLQPYKDSGNCINNNFNTPSQFKLIHYMNIVKDVVGTIDIRTL